MKTRTLFVVDNLQFGGGERVFSQIINGLNPDKYKIFLASLPNGAFYEAITNRHVKFLPLDFSKRFNPSLFFQLKKIIRTNKIQIVHGQGTRAEFYARIANKIAGTSKYVSTIAMPVEGFDIERARKWFYRFFDWISEKFVDRFIVVSDSLKNKMIIDRGINPEKVVRIYNGIEPDQYSPKNSEKSRPEVRNKFNINDTSLVIGAIGRLVWQKGFEYLIQAIPDVIKVYPKVKFLIVGDGPLKAKLEALSMELGVKDKIIFTGFRTDIKEILSALDILVIPSLKEGFPLITLEGMAMAKPIVATRIHGIEEQIANSETGLLVPSQDADALAKTINLLINDRDLALRLGINSRQRAEEEFSVEKMVEETVKIYQSLY
jgi:glycosyltransferase involved in cell wall biosynthesis